MIPSKLPLIVRSLETPTGWCEPWKGPLTFLLVLFIFLPSFVLLYHHNSSGNFQAYVQPALGVLMIGSVAGSFFKDEDEEDL